jgi:teichuronic acid biosynthesis glycosyltransferase TuaG
MKKPLIDVIIPVYNGARFIRETIASIQAQTWKNLEIIVVDDGSEDDSVKIVLEAAKMDKRILLEKRPHAGVAATLNAGVTKGTAAYIAFLDADDLWESQKLEKQMKFLSESAAEICFCLIQEFKTVEPGEGMLSYDARPSPLKGFAKTGFLGYSSVFKKYGLFDETIKTGDFIDWLARVIRAGHHIVTVDEVLAYRRVHAGNNTISVNKNSYLHILKTHLDEARKVNK